MEHVRCTIMSNDPTRLQKYHYKYYIGVVIQLETIDGLQWWSLYEYIPLGFTNCFGYEKTNPRKSKEPMGLSSYQPLSIMVCLLIVILCLVRNMIYV